jgi:catechol 2,3-dioxygenase-like lactoylglutathione lyase family enzyme
VFFNKDKKMITGINHITLAVRDIDESFKFYADVLGLKRIQKSSISAYLLTEDTWMTLTKDQNTRHEHLPECTHIAFTVAQHDFETMKERILKSGAKEWQKNWTEGDSFYFVDPNGHKLEIHASDLETRIESGKQEWGDEVKWFV